MIINPEVITTPDRPTVIVREPMEKVDVDKMIERLLWVQGWGLGTRFDVCFIDHDRTRVLVTGSFLVVEDREELQISEPAPGQSMSRMAQIRRAVPLGRWLNFEALTASDAEAGEGALEVKWNVGRRVYEVKRGEAVLAEDPDKNKAHAIALEMAGDAEAA